MSFSLGLLNWKRKSNVVHIVNNMINFTSISEILISNGNDTHSVKQTDFKESDKIKIYDDWDINDEYGLDRRYINGLRAKNDDIIILDDDIEISEIELNKLITQYNQDKTRIVGKWGRNIRSGYCFAQCFGDVDVVLTPVLVCNKKIFKLFFILKPLIEDIYKTGIPYGNGEDIFLNFISNIYFKNKGFCLDVKTKLLPQMDCAISTNKNHMEYRKNLCKYLMKNEKKFLTFIENILL
tara:strand:- start:59 stop:772 length:714 start_codon:yes stop_codon:yes gene_type:complete